MGQQRTVNFDEILKEENDKFPEERGQPILASGDPSSRTNLKDNKLNVSRMKNTASRSIAVFDNRSSVRNIKDHLAVAESREDILSSCDALSKPSRPTSKYRRLPKKRRRSNTKMKNYASSSSLNKLG